MVMKERSTFIGNCWVLVVLGHVNIVSSILSGYDPQLLNLYASLRTEPKAAHPEVPKANEKSLSNLPNKILEGELILYSHMSI
ncbi:hypothetical protein CMV_002429 [Castanea mollissima]|uniref:Uncharacterized protein n=1 Tax=Castanea mollissima TaxID=60419 RepID=A0A8J4RJ18_9ROSI|nr:hypothetical protein CMV_002429 [Castanea mollissima]